MPNLSQCSPGPWEYDEEDNCVAHINYEHGLAELIADVTPFPREDMQPGRTAANGHLLAAAPDLWDVIKVAREDLARIHSDSMGGDFARVRRTIRSSAEHLDNIIAKYTQEGT